jgi:hypothetical protein
MGQTECLKSDLCTFDKATGSMQLLVPDADFVSVNLLPVDASESFESGFSYRLVNLDE